MEILFLFQASKRLDVDRLVSLIVERRTCNREFFPFDET